MLRFILTIDFKVLVSIYLYKNYTKIMKFFNRSIMCLVSFFNNKKEIIKKKNFYLFWLKEMRFQKYW